MSFQQQSEREFQRQAGLRMAREERAHVQRPGQDKKSKSIGHEAFLEMLMASQARVTFTFNDREEEPVTAVIAHTDKFTISIKKPDGGTRVLFKHALKSFEPVDRPSRSGNE